MGPSENLSRSVFFRAIGARLRAQWAGKIVGLGVGMSAFFVIYFQLLTHPIFAVTVMPVTAFDRWIQFRATVLPLYFSLWIYVSLAFVLLETRRELAKCGVAAATLSALGFAVFLFWPTAIPALIGPVDMPGMFAFLKTIDGSGNACPSLHVAFAVFAAVRLGTLLAAMQAPIAIRVANWVWCGGIAYSTLAAKQHVALDVIAGAVLGAATTLPFFPGRRTQAHR